MPEWSYFFEAKESKQISWARYDAAAQKLEIDFRGKDGGKQSTYEYEGFPIEAWIHFNAAESKGKHFAYAIRPHFTGKKIWQRS